MSDITLILGDCQEKLRDIPDNSVDSVVTDPPAGISFMGKEWDANKGGRSQWVGWLTQVMVETMRVTKPGGHCIVWALPRTSHWTASAIEDAGWEVRDVLTHIFGTGFPKNKALLKPASEHWILCRKPFAGTVAENMAQWGTGELGIDASRIATKDNLNGGAYAKGGTHREDGWGMQRGSAGEYVQPAGRWPTNVVLSHTLFCTDEQCDDDCPVSALDRQSGSSARFTGGTTSRSGNGLAFGMGTAARTGHDDSGGASRFFYVAKPSARERDRGLDDLPLQSCGMMEDDNYAIKTGSGNLRDTKRRNVHPTVKPLALMSHLVRLVTPAGGTCLDPFMGSGTTGMACVAEGLRFIGIEREQEYMDIASRRIASMPVP